MRTGESSNDEERKKGRVWKFPPIFFFAFSSGEKCEWTRRKPGEMKMKMKKSFFLVIFSSLLFAQFFALLGSFSFFRSFFFVVFNGAPENMCTREGGRNMCESVRGCEARVREWWKIFERRTRTSTTVVVEIIFLFLRVEFSFQLKKGP